MQAAATHQAKVKFTRIAKNLFELLFTDENAKTLQKNTFKSKNKKQADKQKRRKHKNTKNSKKSFTEQNKSVIYSKCFTTSDQEN